MEDKNFGVYLFIFLTCSVFVLNYFSIRMVKVSQKKKNKYQTYFWYIYGIIFLFLGIYYSLFQEKIITGLVWLVFSISIIILNYFGKFTPKSS